MLIPDSNHHKSVEGRSGGWVAFDIWKIAVRII